ncbi:MAG: MFS transporter [Chitinivibrionales bacterium]|nr:MFS transporter [Chitinivibrionales bacterium]
MKKTIANTYTRFMSQSRDFYLFLGAIVVTGFAGNIIDSVFNNFLSETFALSNVRRTVLEAPRELPGILVVLVSGFLFFWGSRQLAVLSHILAAAGLVLIGFFSRHFPVMLVWLFIYSLGQHLFMPLSSTIGMELATQNRDGRRLGQFSAAGNIAAIAGSALVFAGFSWFHFSFKLCFVIAALCFVGAATLMTFMTPTKPAPLANRFKMRRAYSNYYLLSVLYGMRKQIFITFAPWVLVTVFHQRTQVIATLLTVGGLIGIFFKPLLGNAIDRFGERLVLCGEAVALVFVCLGYGFSQRIVPGAGGLLIAFACYIADGLLMSCGMARATYLKKIALDPHDIAPTLAMGISMDHVFSISIALLSGLIWAALGYQYVFLMGACIAVVNFFVALQVRTQNPRKISSLAR